MEEVDQIVIHTLRQIGCDLDEDTTSLKQFTTEITVEGVVRCLRLINPELNLPIRVSPNMVARYNLGMALASACTELGFKGDLGYQTFLYSNETEMRRIFMFLFEKLPKESEKVVDQQLGKSAIVLRAISEQISLQLKTPWLPAYCKKDGIRSTGQRWWREDYSNCTRLKTCKLVLPHKGASHVIRPIWEQTLEANDVVPSILELNTAALVQEQEQEAEMHQAGLLTKGSQQEFKQRKKERIQKRILDAFRRVAISLDEKQTLEVVSSARPRMTEDTLRDKGSKFARAEKLQFTKDEQPQNVSSHNEMLRTPKKTSEQEAEAKVATLQQEMHNVAQTLEQLENQEKELSASLMQIGEDIIQKKSKTAELESKNQLEHKALTLLPNAEENILKLQQKIDGAAQTLLSLSAQWEKHRAPLIEQYRDLKEQCSKRLSETQQKLEEIKSMRDKMKDIQEQARNKDELHKQLLSEYEKLVKDVSRSAYTKRIYEIVGNIKKQKEEIAKVLMDTKALQKEINHLTGKLDRTFTVTDELIFKDAKKDEAVRRAYKYLAAVHENSNQLLQAVEDTGAILREVRDLEDQIEQESQKKVVANLERITADYKQMKQENASLLAQLKAE
ncbi:coiled-coil domain-containing protein 22 homolog [Ornithodoros turicata]|uniref:coiled-coil domain-containing protein 22 homolog n=1 Tax=Ornithodoros turicata TaxID=34597 RepID=UPI003138C074